MIRRRALIYTLVIAASVAAIVAVLRVGEVRFGGSNPASDVIANGMASSKASSHAASPLAILIVQLLAVIVATQTFGSVARLLRQPAVIGEIAAGLLLGPSLLGMVWPDAYASLFPPASLGSLQLLSQVGVILFMFSVGLDVDTNHLRHQAPTAIAVSHFSIVVPFLLGTTISLLLYTPYAPAGVPFHSFALFMGIALSITAFPVLARVLEERGMARTPLGTTAIACAAVDDVTAWSLLAVVVTLVSAGEGGALALMAVALVVFVGVMIGIVRPWLRALFPADEPSLTRGKIALTLVIMLAAALATERIGIHALFGAFLAGAMMPPHDALRRQLRERLESISGVFLLPLFFAFTGLRTEIGLLNTVSSWLVCGGIILTAIAGKLVGTMLAARWTGAQWRDAFVLGALMNTRGLMELVALNVGYDLGILSPQMFTMLVVMALVTTAMTGPLLDRANAWKPRL